MGIENIVAVDGEQKRLDFAKKMGAEKSVNFKDFQGVEALAKGVEDAFGGYPADFAFQCTGSPIAHANIYKFIRMVEGFVNLDSSSMVEMQQSTHTSTCVQKRSHW